MTDVRNREFAVTLEPSDGILLKYGDRILNFVQLLLRI